jgi:ArsR family transcriptional regulator
MDLIKIYECFCDRTRLRILHLLSSGPLCVCHIQEILDESQVTVSKRLAFLKSRGLVKAERHANWMHYSLPEKPSAELAANLACLQDCVQEEPEFRRDAAKLKRLRERLSDEAKASANACKC